MLKIVSFNVNGIRARPHQLAALKERHDPDIIGIQECKVADDVFPLDMVEGLGYVTHFFGQKAHYGVALLSKQAPIAVTKGLPGDSGDAQRRLITGTYRLATGDEVTVINGYFPQGESRAHPVKFPGKRKFYADLIAYLREGFRPDQNLVLLGDMNVAPLDLDIGIGEDNARRWLYDTYRTAHPETEDCFSWFDYRSRGFEREPKRGLRIDLLLASAPLRERLLDVGVDYDIRGMAKPSDHCPVWATFDL